MVKLRKKEETIHYIISLLGQQVGDKKYCKQAGTKKEKISYDTAYSTSSVLQNLLKTATSCLRYLFQEEVGSNECVLHSL